MGGEKRNMEKTMMESYVFTPEIASAVLGPNDSNLPYLEALLRTDLSVRGTSISASSPSPLFVPLMKRLEKIAGRDGTIAEPEIFMEYQLLSEPDAEVVADEKVFIAVQGRSVYPKSAEQRRFMKALAHDPVVMALGPAGTGKTFLSIIWALSEVLSGRRSKLLLARPVVEAGESLGFLPGDLQQKLSPYLRPLYDAMEYVLHPQQIRRLEESGTIEIAPLAYMRGRSVNNAVMILDEAQNASRSQMKMFLTRLGENSQLIVSGDPSQIDLARRSESGLEEAASLLSGIEGVSVIRFTHKDTIRSRIVRDIVRAYSEGNDEDNQDDC